MGQTPMILSPPSQMTSATSASFCEDGLIWRYGTTDVEPRCPQRLEYELSVIVKKNFCSYFLIVWDFCNFARDNGIPVGARGSGVGTMVGYLLGLCNVDPIKYNLLFERFMDPSRNEMPDIDIDICQEGRQRGDRIRPQQIRARRADHHVWHTRRQGRVQGCRPRAGGAAAG